MKPIKTEGPKVTGVRNLWRRNGWYYYRGTIDGKKGAWASLGTQDRDVALRRLDDAQGRNPELADILARLEAVEQELAALKGPARLRSVQ